MIHHVFRSVDHPNLQTQQDDQKKKQWITMLENSNATTETTGRIKYLDTEAYAKFSSHDMQYNIIDYV
jgi:hypothetical protein